MLKLSQILFPVIAVCLTVACDRPDCINTNPVFDQYSPESEEYKNELINQLKLNDGEELRYWLKKYDAEHGQEYLYFYVQGGNLCAVMQMKVDNWKGMEDLREKKGVSYRGAEFKGLTYQVSRDESGTKFTYQSYQRIID